MNANYLVVSTLEPIGPSFPTARDLVQYGLDVVDRYKARIQTWLERPIVDLTHASEGHRDELDIDIWKQCIEAQGQMCLAVKTLADGSESPTEDLVDTVTGSLRTLLINYRAFFWHWLVHLFDDELGNGGSSECLDAYSEVAPLAYKDVVESSLTLCFLDQLRERVLKTPSHTVATVEPDRELVTAK